MLWPKKNSYKEFDNKKRFLPLENSPPPPPHNFSKWSDPKVPIVREEVATHPGKGRNTGNSRPKSSSCGDNTQTIRRLLSSSLKLSPTLTDPCESTYVFQLLKARVVNTV